MRARIDLHARFGTKSGSWFEWLWEREQPEPGSRLLEIGCGPAELWKVALPKLDPAVSLTLSDFSAGMIESARRVVGDRATYVVADVHELPFPDESFDVVIANHMLYHVADRPRAFAEIRRVLGPRGRFHAATNGQGHMRELQDLVPDWQFAGHVDLFGLESAPEQLEPFFTDITVERFDDALEVTEVEPVLAYIRSSNTYVGQDLGPARETVEAAIVRDGAFRVEKHPGLVSARKP